MNATTNNTTTAAKNAILDTLLAAETGLTLAEIARALCLPCGEVRLAVEGLDGSVIEGKLERPVVEGAGDDVKLGRAVRVYYATDAGRAAREADLYAFGEQAPEAALREATKDTLRVAALTLGVEGLKVKATKDTLVAAILAYRASLGLDAVCVECKAEPVSKAGDVCAPCEETKNPVTNDDEDATGERGPRKPRAPRAAGDIRVHIRRPDVALDSFTDAERAEVANIIKTASSQRAAQRDVGYWLAGRDAARFVNSEVLRTFLRVNGVLNAANFTINAKKEGWTRVNNGITGELTGWTIANLDIKVAAKGAQS